MLRDVIFILRAIGDDKVVVSMGDMIRFVLWNSVESRLKRDLENPELLQYQPEREKMDLSKEKQNTCLDIKRGVIPWLLAKKTC